MPEPSVSSAAAASWSLMVPDRASAQPMDLSAKLGRRVTETREAGQDDTATAYLFGKDGVSFEDLLDSVNPLHHLPIIGPIYRAMTGDELAPAARMAGGTLYGGPIGFAAALANMAVEEATGQDIGGLAIAAFTGGPAVDDETGTVLAAGSDPSQPLQDAPDPALQLAALAMPAGSRPMPRVHYGSPIADEPVKKTASPVKPDTGSQGEAQATAALADSNAASRATRISGAMAKHLAMLAQQSGPAARPGPADIQPPPPAQQGPDSAARIMADNIALPSRVSEDAAAASLFTNAALPRRVDGSAPDANPFLALQRPVGRPIPERPAAPLHAAAVEQRASPIVPPPGHGVALAQHQTAPGATGSTSTVPPDHVPQAMLAALQRYQALKGAGG